MIIGYLDPWGKHPKSPKRGDESQTSTILIPKTEIPHLGPHTEDEGLGFRV